MPTTSAAQHRLMEGVAHDPAFAEKVGIPQSVGREFVAADLSGPELQALDLVIGRLGSIVERLDAMEARK